MHYSQKIFKCIKKLLCECVHEVSADFSGLSFCLMNENAKDVQQ
jgi:hypothetical protein